MLIFIIILLFFLFMVGMPIVFSIGIVSISYIGLIGNLSLLITVPQRIVTGMDSFALIAIPLFLLSGNIMSKGETIEKLVNLALALVGHFRGGMVYVSVVTNMIMAGMSGSAAADASATGSIFVPIMTKRGYPRSFSAALIAAAATIGPIIPPSIPFVLIGSLANVSIGRLFLGGVIPGVLMGIYLMITGYIISKKRNYESARKFSIANLLRSLFPSLPALLLPFIIIGGIIGGVFTPTEAGIIASVYALAIEFIVYKKLKKKDLFTIFFETAVTSSQVMFIIGMANVLGWVLARMEIPTLLTELFLSFSQNPLIVLLIINIGFLIWGCFFGIVEAIILVMPILIPILGDLGIDPVHFGVLVTVNLMIGGLTPPFGVLMYLLCSIAEISMVEFQKECYPFVIALIIVLFIITYIPQTVLFIPNLLMGVGK